MGSFKIEFKRSVEREIRQISALLVPNILRRIEALSETPFPRQATKLEGAERLYRLRVGRFRVVYEVDQKRETIVIYHVRHRREAYRSL